MKRFKYLNEKQLIQYRKRVLKDSDKYGATEASRMYGIGRASIYEWKKSLYPKKPGPKDRVSWQTDKKIEDMVVKLRIATNYGPKRLKPELELVGITLGEKAIRGILNRKKLVKNHKKKRVRKQKRFYAPYPGYRIQMDTKAVPDEGFDLRSEAARHQYTAIDIATKIRLCLIYEELSNHNAIDFLKRVLEFFESISIKVECVQTDNHATFTNIYAGGNKKDDHELLRVHPFTLECLKRGIEHKLSSPGRPQQNCFVERSHRTDEEEFYRNLDLSKLNNEQLQIELSIWNFNYNFNRIHSSCQNKPPMKYYQETVWTTGA